ncbi:MAG TPA: hypothetical protein V6D17_07960 [Candidatus Obscuribacterales bacterium]
MAYDIPSQSNAWQSFGGINYLDIVADKDKSSKMVIKTDDIAGANVQARDLQTESRTGTEPPMMTMSDFWKEDMLKNIGTITDVIMRNDDFGYGEKRDRVKRVLEQFVNGSAESAREVVDALNKDLEKKGSPLRVEGLMTTVERRVDPNYDGNPRQLNHTVYRLPYIAEHKALQLILKRGGIVEDQIQVIGKEVGRRSVDELKMPWLR